VSGLELREAFGAEPQGAAAATGAAPRAPPGAPDPRRRPRRTCEVSSGQSGASRRTRYLLPRRPLASQSGFSVSGEAGAPRFEVRAAVPGALVLERPDGGEDCTIHEATLSLQRLMRLSRRGEPAAWVRREVTVPVREHYAIDLGSSVLTVRGNVPEHEYAIRHGRHSVAAVSRAWVSASEAYCAEVAPGQDDALLLAVTVCLTLMSGGPG
jgi:uncharacterized protein YxjI